MKEQLRPAVQRKEYSRREVLFGGAAWVGNKALEALLGEEKIPNWPLIRVKTDMPYVCIGIDDGWYPEKVELFLKVMEEYQSKFTVFPVGKVMTKSPDLWWAVKAAGHHIGNHSHGHLNVRGKTKERIRWDFNYFEEFDYREVFGEAFPKPGWARVPFAEAPVKANQNVRDVLFEMDDFDVHWRYDSYSWNTDGVDNARNREYCLKNIGQLEQGDIGVMHFTALDLAILPQLLEILAEKGLTNVPFSVLWEARKNK